jgi:hypothetical protein
MTGDGLADLLGRVERLPRAVRIGAMLVVPLLLLGALVASFALAPGGELHSRAWHAPGAPAQRPPARLVPPSRTPTPATRDVPLSAATDPALRFLRGYLAYAYGRGTLEGIRDADSTLIRTLRRNHVRVPPAARGRRARITSLHVIAQAHYAAQATATIDDGGGRRYPLVFYLDRRPGGWTVTRLGND